MLEVTAGIRNTVDLLGSQQYSGKNSGSTATIGPLWPAVKRKNLLGNICVAVNAV
jgi:hypothetical protein